MAYKILFLVRIGKCSFASLRMQGRCVVRVYFGAEILILS